MIPQSNKGTPHGSSMPPSLDSQNNLHAPQSMLLGQTPKYLNAGHAQGGGLASLNYNSNQSASNGSLSMLPQEHMGGKLYLPQNVDSRQMMGRENGAQTGSHQGHQQNFSPVPQSQKRKPPLPSPFIAKLEGSHSKLALYSQNQIAMAKADNQAYQFSKVGSVASKKIQNDDNKTMQYNMKNHHHHFAEQNPSLAKGAWPNPYLRERDSAQISQGHIPTMGQIQGNDEEMRQTFNKMMKPKISKALPPAFAGISKGNSKKSKKHFQEFSKIEQQKQQTNNYVINRIDTALEAEEFKHMQNMLEPLNIDRERAAYTKIDQYNSGSTGAGSYNPHHHAKLYNNGSQSNKMNSKQYEQNQLDSFSKYNLIPGNSEKQHLSQSSGFSTFDTFSLRNAGYNPEPIRLDQMVTLSIFKSTSGTIKKMLHGPSLKIYCVKEVPISNREIRKVLKSWIANWERFCTSEQYIRIFDTFWNSPEGCVSVVSDFAANGSLQNLIQSIGALPETTLKHLARSILRSIESIHDKNLTHTNITSSQIVFDRRGKVRLSPGFGHILKSKNETSSTLDQHLSLSTMLCGDTRNFANKAQLIKDKFSHLVNQGNQLNQVDIGSGIYANSINELKKVDLFDLGVVLTICATGGFDMVNEELLTKLTDFSKHCCLIHALNAVKTAQLDTNLLSTLLSLRKVFSRISTQAQDFICQCMQQRFTDQEQQQRGINPSRGSVTASSLLNSQWVTGSSSQRRPGESQVDSEMLLKLSIKELLNVSSDWKDVNHLGGGAGGGFPGQEPLSKDFQAKQIERVVEAIAMTLPAGANHSMIGGLGMGMGSGNTLSTANLDIGHNLSDPMGSSTNVSQFRYEDYLIKELAFDLGVDMMVLKRQLLTLFSFKL